MEFIFQNKKIKLVIEEDVVGWYLIGYYPPFDKSFCDYLQDSKEDIFRFAEEKFEVKENQWKQIE